MPPEGSQTNCPSCGSTVSSALRFCPQCGKPLYTRPVCSSCGAELVPGIRFCRQCGGKIPGPAGVPGKKTVPALETGTAAGNGSRYPATAGSALPVKEKTGLSGLKKIAFYAIGAIVLVLVALIAVGFLLPDDADEESVPSFTTSPGSSAAGDLRPSRQEIDAREKARSGIVAALRQGNGEGVIALLIQNDQEKYRSGFGISTDDMKIVATAIESATVTEETFRAASYRTRVGDTEYSFMAVREEGTWKFAGI